MLIKQFVLNTRVRIRDPYHLTATPPTLLIDFVHSPRNGFVDVQEGLKNWYRNIFGLRSYFSIFFFFLRKTKNSIGKSCMSVHSGFRFFSQFFFCFRFFPGPKAPYKPPHPHVNFGRHGAGGGCSLTKINMEGRGGVCEVVRS